MKIYRSLSEFKKTNLPLVLTPGTFDGVHIGHQKIIQRVNNLANEVGGESVVLSFHPHPRLVLFPNESNIKLIQTLDEKIAKLAQYNINHFIILPFTKSFSRLSAIEYVRDILINQIGINKLVIGYDHQFGRNREGSYENLKELSSLYEFDIEEIPAQDIDSVKISSTKIRKAILEGDLLIANNYLGYTFEINAKVSKGNKIGNKIGFPTANLTVDKHKIIPAEGVYAVKVKYKDKIYGGMLNIGTNPTIGNQNQTIEVNIFDFNQDIYDQEISVFFYQKIRDEKKFSGIEQLKEQLNWDKIKVLNII